MRVALRVNGWVSAVLSMVVAGCGAQSQVPPFAVIDSAGIQIVETTTPLWSSGASWTVSDTPVLVIGEVEGRVHEVFAGVTGVVRMSDGRIAVADRGSSEIRFFHPEPAPEGLVWPLSAIGPRRILLGAGRPFGGQLTPGVHMDTATFMIADLDGEVEARLLREIPFPETFPPFADLVLDSEGYLWAQKYRGPGERSTRWMIVDPDGRWLGTVEGPDAFRLHRAGSDYLLGVHADELGVEQVRMYRLSR